MSEINTCFNPTRISSFDKPWMPGESRAGRVLDWELERRVTPSGVCETETSPSLSPRTGFLRLIVANPPTLTPYFVGIPNESSSGFALIRIIHSHEACIPNRRKGLVAVDLDGCLETASVLLDTSSIQSEDPLTLEKEAFVERYNWQGRFDYVQLIPRTYENPIFASVCRTLNLSQEWICLSNMAPEPHNSRADEQRAPMYFPVNGN